MKSVLTFIIASIMLLAYGQNKNVPVTNSKITWTGYKIAGEHSGTINLQKGTLVVKKNGNISGGKFVVDMTSINTTDLSGKSKTSLDDHLKSEDFFDTAQYPTATLSFSKIGKKSDSQYSVTAKLTLKGITKNVAFVLNASQGKAQAKLTINRTLFGIEYKSGSIFSDLGDKAISDNFDINISFNY